MRKPTTASTIMNEDPKRYREQKKGDHVCTDFRSGERQAFTEAIKKDKGD